MASDWMSLIRESLEYLENTPEIDTVGGCLILDTFEERYQLDWIALDWIHILHSRSSFPENNNQLPDRTFCEWQSVA